MILALLLGVMTMEGKPQYRTKVWTENGITYYQPQRRTNILSGWEDYRHPFQYKSLSQDIIEEWKREYNIKHKKMEYQYETI